MTYDHKVPKVFILDLESGQQQLVGLPRSYVCPRFSPDGKKVI